MGKSWLMRQHYFRWAKANPEGYDEQIGKRGGYWVEGADLAPSKAKKQGGWELLYPRILEITNQGRGPSKGGRNPRVGLAGGILRLEDADGFLPQSIRGTPWQPVFLENAHLRLDVQLNAHRPQTLDKNILCAAHHWFIFAMAEPYAFEYLAKLGQLEGSEVMRKEQWPTKKGQYIHVTNDPSRSVAAGARFYDDYYPELDQGGGR